MNLTDSRLKELENPTLTDNERILLRCRLSSEFIHIGQYESAREALGELWHGIGKRPDVEEIPPVIAAEVLLQCGVLSGWLGSAQNISGAQERAKDLLSEALRKFDSQSQPVKVSEVQYEFGMCYWRLGAYDEARVILDEAIRGLGGQDTELRAKILIRHTLVELWTGRYHDAWNILKEAQPFFENCGDAIKGRWHGQLAIILLKLASTEGRTDYADRAIIEFTAAIYHYEQAHHERYCGTNQNNLAFLLYKLGRYKEAHEHLDQAHRIFERHKDSGNIAQVNETRARVFIAEQKYREANRIIASVVQTFEKGGETALLADALTVQGIAWARLGVYENSINILRQAMRIAQDCGAPVNAGLAALTLIEEHGAARLSQTELYEAYRRADKMLRTTQDAEDIARLRACARIGMKRLSGARIHDRDFNLYGVVYDFEAKFIEQALEESEGSVTRAAKLLGMRHQSLAYLLKTRHKKLLKKRKPARQRGRTVFKMK